MQWLKKETKMHVTKKALEQMTAHLRQGGNTEQEIAEMLDKLRRVYEVAYEIAWAKTPDHAKAAYLELIDLIKGKAD